MAPPLGSQKTRHLTRDQACGGCVAKEVSLVFAWHPYMREHAQAQLKSSPKCVPHTLRWSASTTLTSPDIRVHVYVCCQGHMPAVGCSQKNSHMGLTLQAWPDVTASWGKAMAA